MTATLKRVWAHYRIASMVKATPDESATYLKEIKKEQRMRGYDWAPSTWNRYRERAAALFTYAERNQLVPKGSNPFTEARCKDYVEFKQSVPARRIPVDVQKAIYTASYAYNAASDLTSASDNSSAYAYAYNADDLVTSVDNNGTPGPWQGAVTHTTTMSGDVYVGIGLSAHADGKTATATFDHVSVTSPSNSRRAAR